MATADGMHAAFSGRHPTLVLISDLYRHLTEITEVHYTPVTFISSLPEPEHSNTGKQLGSG